MNYYYCCLFYSCSLILFDVQSLFSKKDIDDCHHICDIHTPVAIDIHHASDMMQKIAELREKYDLHMRVERFVSDDLPSADEGFIRK